MRVYQKGEDLYIEVSDNGIGMPKEMVEQLLAENNHVPKKGSGVGLINVHNRLRLRFGNSYGLEIESIPDEGTCVCIHLPYIIYSAETQRRLEGGKQRRQEGDRSSEET